MIGIKSNRAELKDYSTEYKNIADNTINKLNKLIGDKVKNIEHIGSTAIIGIKSKPIIDIVVGVDSLDIVDEIKEVLEQNDFIFAKLKLNSTVAAFKCEEEGRRTHNVYIVILNGDRWKEFIYFRDYLSSNPNQAKKYEKIKIGLSKKYCDDIHKYTEGKNEFIKCALKSYEDYIKTH